MKIFAFIFARGGSKGIKNKNLKKIKGLSLVGRAVKQAMNIKEINKVYISSNDRKILNEGKVYGAETILRPQNLCKDNSLEMNSWIHAINYLKKKKINFDLMLVVPCTSPLRNKKDILDCINNFKSNLHMVMTIYRSKFHPALNIVKKNKYDLINRLTKVKNINQRQDVKDNYLIANSVYLFNPKKILKNPRLFHNNVLGVEIPKSRAIDIDDDFDLKICKTLI